MKIKIVKNKYLNALLLLMLLSAILHMLVLFSIVIVSGNFYLLNYISILNLNYFSPNFLNSVAGSVASFVFVVGLYIGIFKYNQ